MRSLLLDAPSATPLPPRGLTLRGEALAALGRSGEAYGLLGALRQQQALAETRLAGLEAAVGGCIAARSGRRQRAGRPLGSAAQIAAQRSRRRRRVCRTRRRDALGRSGGPKHRTRTGRALGRIAGDVVRTPADRPARPSAARVPKRWLQAHPASPALLTTLARLARAQGQWPQAEAYLHRALAQGAHRDAWEELGDGFAQAGDDALARQSYANALRAARGEADARIARPGPAPDHLRPGRGRGTRRAWRAAIEGMTAPSCAAVHLPLHAGGGMRTRKRFVPPCPAGPGAGAQRVR